MFLRRDRLPPHRRFQEFLWPAIGWGRATRYMGHRLARLPGTPFSLGAGLACGAAVSFTPFVGLHFVLAGLMAWSMRANIIASAIGTAVGNPWTFPFIWVWTFQLGKWMGIGETGAEGLEHEFSNLFGSLLTALLQLDFESFFGKFWPIWWPMLIGSLPTAVAVWAASYFAAKPVIALYQHRRVVRRSRKRAALRHAQEREMGKEVQE